MSYLLKILCISLSMFYLCAASPVPRPKDFEQVLVAIANLTSLNHMVKCGFVYALIDPQNYTLAEISCRALISLKHCNSTNNNNIKLNILTRSLKYFQKNVTCAVPEDTRQEDIFSFLKSLFKYFQKENYSLKPQPI